MKKLGFAALLASALAAAPATATGVIDPAGDFLAGHAGSQDPDPDVAPIEVPRGVGTGNFLDLITPAGNFALQPSAMSIAASQPGAGDTGVIKRRALVPEPVGWALLIAGFGLIGATLRRRRGSIASVTA